MSATPDQASLVDQDRRPPSTIPVTINNKTVQLPEREMTGLEIKQAAAAQGLPIDPGFQLSVKRGNRYDIVGDTDTVHIHRNLDFLAVAPDDNS
ncbi:multiubiquitin domain-containing protein [Streptomyces rhizosphaerihabitans]|uniref:multiubiquitin domain-containing protein n=1 Tax=Streptomyces rhizosphaerihabitans TaxID=1266770 RepID=UPI0021BF77B9|nr:multiubiquitin domain-containing protein [Streptomyces rhizosphaerihabitans]MCT9004602.1 multiubiquitin domain-containing protein [Streptomyces rhizosphaerihabitans]